MKAQIGNRPGLNPVSTHYVCSWRAANGNRSCCFRAKPLNPTLLN